MKNKIDRDELIRLHLIEGLTEAQCAVRLNVKKSAIVEFKRSNDIRKGDAWKHVKVHCSECGKELDPDVELTKNARKRLIRKKHKVCSDCKEAYQRQYNREAQAKWRQNNREKYNESMRKWRAENKERWKEIKDRSKNRGK